MDLQVYADWTITTAKYPGVGTGNMNELAYLDLGIAEEAGEVSGKIKRLLRGEDLDMEGIIKELGDVAWYWARLCCALGAEPRDVLNENVCKLSARLKAGTIHGSGIKDS
jgi:NTP pyrophosphatase (non-canonical NTP hydrolase)